LPLAAKVRLTSHREPYNRGANHCGKEREEGSIGETTKISLKFKSLKKGYAP
jgi:hypothetical protein